MPAAKPAYRARKLRINSSGYTPEGYYYGVGPPPAWEVWTITGLSVVVRAGSRPEAIDAGRKLLGRDPR